MSLDIYLESVEFAECVCECGDVHCRKQPDSIAHFNITHNLTKMAELAVAYGYIWRPGENGITTAQQMIEHLKSAIKKLESDPKKFKAVEPENGWGTYKGFLEILKEYLVACKNHPTAKISVCR